MASVLSKRQSRALVHFEVPHSYRGFRPVGKVLINLVTVSTVLGERVGIAAQETVETVFENWWQL